MSNNDNFDSVRYSTLIDLWQHQNSMLWKWPAVVFGVTTVLASKLIGGDVQELKNITQSPNILLGVVFSIKSSFEIAVFVSMKRARFILIRIRDEISRIEADQQVEENNRFSEVAHPFIRNSFFRVMRVSGFSVMMVAVSFLTLSSILAAAYYFFYDCVFR